MALVRDPLTGQMIDDGRPSGVLDTIAAQTARTGAAADAQRVQDQRQRGAAVLNQTRDGFGNALLAPRMALAMLPKANFQDGLPDWRSPSEQALSAQQATQYSPQAQAGAVRAYDMAQNAVGAAQQPFTGGVAASLLAPGAVPAQPSLSVAQRPTTPQAPAYAPGTVGGGGLSAGDQSVLTQDRANLQNAVNTLNTNFDTWRVPQPSIPAMQTAAGGGAGGLSADQQPQRGNYTQTNTNLDALRQRALPTAGIDLGAAALAAQQATAQQQPGGINVHGLSRSAEDMATSNDPFLRRAGLARMQIEGAQAIEGTRAQSELARAQLAGSLGLQEANLRGQYGLQGANVQGQYGLQERALANQGQLEAAKQTGLASLAAAQAKAAGVTQAAQLKAQASSGADAVHQGNIEMARTLYAQGADPATVNAALNGTLRPNVPAQPRLVQGTMGTAAVMMPDGTIRQLTPAEAEAMRFGNSLAFPAK